MKHASFAALASTFLSFVSAGPAHAALVDPAMDSTNWSEPALGLAATVRDAGLPPLDLTASMASLNRATGQLSADAFLPLASQDQMLLSTNRSKSTLPEPSTWALLAAGFCATGLVMRTRPRPA